MLLYETLNINKKDYISPIYKKLYSTTIKYSFGYTLVRKYNREEECYYFYIIAFKHKPNNITVYSMKKEGTQVKIPLSMWWNKLPIQDNKEDVEVDITIDEDTNDYTAYRLNI